MDVQRRRPKRWLRTGVIAGVALAGVALAVIVMTRPPRPDSLRRSSVWTGHAERGRFAVRVRGAGTLVPEAVRWLTAESSGRVEEILLKPGAAVAADTPILRLENLDIRLLAVQADREVASARAEIMALERGLGEDELVREAEAAQLRAASTDAGRVADADARMSGIMPDLELRRAGDQAHDLEVRAALADRRLALVRRAGPQQLATLRTQLQAYLDMAVVRHQIVDHLAVQAGASGTLENVQVELGQWVVPGTTVARVILSDRLKAELKIPEEQAGRVVIGQAATIDTHSGTATGRIRRVASAASQGTVVVEIALDGDMPKGARADQTVDGVVEVDQVADALFIPRPMNVQPDSTASLFRVDAGGVATRVSVRTGRASVDSIEILSGLAAGDEVILSDTSHYADVDTLSLD